MATATLYPYCNLVAFGDFHASQTGEFSRTIGASGLSPLGERLLNTASWIKSEWLGCNAVILNNGDFTSIPGVIDAPTNYLLQKLQKEFDKSNMKQIINLGNHDIDNKVGLNNLHILESSTCTVLPPNRVAVCLIGAGQPLYVVPFTFDLSFQKELLDSIPDGSLVAIHTPVIGVHMTPGVLETSGIPFEYFKRFRLTISSHYHLPQVDGVRIFEPMVLDLTPGMFIGLGAPLARTFSDTNPVYGIWGFDFTNNKAEFSANPYSPIYTNTLPIDPPMDREIFVSLDLTTIEAAALSSTIQEQPTNVHVRVRKKSQPSTQARSSIVTSSPLENVLAYLAVSNIQHDPTLSRKVLEECLTGAVAPPGLGSRVEFHRLRIENFFSFESAEVEFQKSGLTFVSGVNQDTSGSSSNGSGKSSLFESLVWCLYDQTLRDLDEGKDSLIRKGQDKAVVSVDFSIEGKDYTVTRSRSKGKPGLSLMYEGQDISRGLAPAANRQVVALLGIPYSVFIASTFFTNNSEGRFSLMTDSARKTFLASALGEDLSVYDTIRENLSEKVREHDRVVTYLKASIASSMSSLEEFGFKLESEILTADKLELARTQTIAVSQANLLDLSKEFSTLKVEVDLRTKTLEEEQTAYASRIAVASSRASQLALVRRSLEIANTTWKETQEALDKTNTFSSNCSLCEQPLPESKIKPLNLMREHTRATLFAKQSELRAELHKLQEMEHSLSDPSAELPSLNRFSKEGELQVLKEKMNSLRIQVTVLSKQISDLQAKDYQEGIRVLKGYIASHETKLSEAQQQQAVAEQKELALGTLMSALSPTGVVSYILDATVDELNSYLESYGKIIFSGDYSMSLSSTKSLQSGKESNKIALRYTTEGGSYGLSSSGEKRKADIALFLALNSMLTAHGRGTTNLMVADEALDSLDPVAASVLVEGLLLFAKEAGKSVYLTSHSGDVTALVDQSIVVTRQHGISRCKVTIN